MQVALSQPIGTVAVDITDLYASPECLLVLFRLRSSLRGHGITLTLYRRTAAPEPTMARVTHKRIGSHRAG
jgi:hypothetical protein